MYQVYENFIVWLLLWTPWDNGLRFNLEDGLDQTLESFFWEAIAPNKFRPAPWEIQSRVNTHFIVFGTEDEIKGSIYDYYDRHLTHDF